MKVILLQDVAKVGRKHDVVEAKDGFARNFLLGTGKAVLANKENLARIEGLKKNQVSNQIKTISTIEQLVSQLQEQPLTVKVKVSPEGHLFAALHAKEISAEIKKQFGLDIPSDLITIPEPIKKVGESKIALQSGNRASEIKILVEAI